MPNLLTSYGHLLAATIWGIVAALATWQATGSPWAGVAVATFLEALGHVLAFQLKRAAEASQAEAEAAAERAKEFLIAHAPELQQQASRPPQGGFPPGVARATRRPPS